MSRTYHEVIKCDVCDSQSEAAKVRTVFGVDICDGCFAARAGETLDKLRALSKERDTLLSQRNAAAAQQAGLRNSLVAKK